LTQGGNLGLTLEGINGSDVVREAGVAHELCRPASHGVNQTEQIGQSNAVWIGFGSVLLTIELPAEGHVAVQAP